METIGPNGYINKSENIRVLIDALYSLGFNKAGNLLVEEYGNDLHSPAARPVLAQVNNGEQDDSIATLQEMHLEDEKAMKLQIIEQKFFEVLNTGTQNEAMKILRLNMVPLDVMNMERLNDLSVTLVLSTTEESE